MLERMDRIAFRIVFFFIWGGAGPSNRLRNSVFLAIHWWYLHFRGSPAMGQKMSEDDEAPAAEVNTTAFKTLLEQVGRKSD